jgi:hypothetical protein
VKFGPDGGTKSGTGNVSTTGTTSPTEALQDLAHAMNVPWSTVQSIQQAMGLSDAEMTDDLGAVAGGLIANPSATPGDLAGLIGASPAQQTAAAKGTKTASGGGDVTNIVGDIFEVLYPWLMFGLAATTFVVFLLIAVVAIAKSPAGQGAVQGASAGAGFAALAA